MARNILSPGHSAHRTMVPLSQNMNLHSPAPLRPAPCTAFSRAGGAGQSPKPLWLLGNMHAWSSTLLDLPPFMAVSQGFSGAGSGTECFHVVLLLTVPTRQLSNYSRLIANDISMWSGKRARMPPIPAGSGHPGPGDEALHTQHLALGMMCKCPETLLHGEHKALLMRNRTNTS